MKKHLIYIVLATASLSYAEPSETLKEAAASVTARDSDTVNFTESASPIPQGANVGVDLANPEATGSWYSEPANWGKILAGAGAGVGLYMVGDNNHWWGGNAKEDSPKAGTAVAPENGNGNVVVANTGNGTVNVTILENSQNSGE